jgi:hypothetical protein
MKQERLLKKNTILSLRKENIIRNENKISFKIVEEEDCGGLKERTDCLNKARPITNVLSIIKPNIIISS